MKALLYLYLTRIKNKLKAMVKNPGSLVFSLFIVAMLVITVMSALFSEKHTIEYRSHNEVYAMILLLYCSIFASSCMNGISKGASLYTMPDINFVFPSPIQPKSVILYGLIQQMGTSLIIGLFLVFQYGWLHSTYGVSFVFLIIILFGYAITLFCGNLTALIIYSFTTGNEIKKKRVKSLIYFICGLPLIYIFIEVLQNRDHWLYAGVSAINNLWFKAFPVGGWAQATVVGIWKGEWYYVIFGLLAIILFIMALVYVLTNIRTDYYEDVLMATEISQSAITASKEGRFDAVMTSNVKVGSIGLGKGRGADTLYYKHRLERRRSGKLLLNRNILTFLFIIWAFTIFMRDNGIVPVFIFSTYMQFFTIAMGRWIRELLFHHIYLIPESAISKLLHCLRENTMQLTVEAIVLFIPVSLFLKLDIIETLLCITARISFGFLFTAGLILTERFFSGIVIKVLSVVLYFITMIILAIPGIALAFLVIGFEVFGNMIDIPILLSLTVANTMVSVIVLFCCRNMLEYAELNYR